MRWKVPEGDTVVYRTEMNEMDTAAYARLGGAPGALFDSAGSSLPQQWGDAMARANSEVNTYLVRRRPGVIGIEMREVKLKGANDAADTSLKEMRMMMEMMARMSGGVQLRGSVLDDGRIESFYLNESQRNLLALMFELPARPVRVGDTWPLSVTMIHMDQNFICDSAARSNSVKLTEIRKTDHGPLAILAYDIDEYVDGTFGGMLGEGAPTMMHITFTAQAGFDIERGGWAFYDGVMSVSSTGIMSTSQRKRFVLVPK